MGFTVHIYIVIFLYGIVTGSFLNVCIYRIPRKEDIVKRSSHCMSCGTKLAWKDLIPLFSFLYLKGSCRYCGAKLSWQYPIVELVNGILYVLIFIVKGINLISAIYCLFVSALLVLSIIDWRSFEIPATINGFILVLGVIRLFLDIAHWQEYVLGFFSVSLFLFVIYQISGGRVIGGGDVKLMAAGGLVLGWRHTLLAFFIGCLLGSIVHLMRMKISKVDHVLALGPYLSAGFLISMLAGENFLDWYFNVLL